ncbi:MAG: HEPN domain-containing protein [Chloroflexota bacterium]|nr:HEPN domain-containing protein [Chloroflexota bacterium]
MDKTTIAKEWFEIAELDLASANYLQDMQPVPVEIICYHCQQAAEKYLKGFLAYFGHEIVKTHDLVLLNKLCQKAEEDFETIEEDCLLLTDYSVTIRYPYPLELNESDMRLALKNAGKIQNFVVQKIT